MLKMKMKAVKAMNEHSAMFDDINKWYHEGYWKKKQVKNAVKKGKITEEEYREIVGEDYA